MAQGKKKTKLSPREKALHALRFINSIFAGSYGGFFWDSEGQEEEPDFKEARRIIEGVIEFQKKYYRPGGGGEVQTVAEESASTKRR